MANSDSKTAEQVRRLRKMIESREVRVGQSISGSVLRDSCRVHSTWEQDRFDEAVMRYGLASYDGRSDTYTVTGG